MPLDTKTELKKAQADTPSTRWLERNPKVPTSNRHPRVRSVVRSSTSRKMRHSIAATTSTYRCVEMVEVSINCYLIMSWILRINIRNYVYKRMVWPLRARQKGMAMNGVPIIRAFPRIQIKWHFTKRVALTAKSGCALAWVVLFECSLHVDAAMSQ